MHAGIRLKWGGHMYRQTAPLRTWGCQTPRRSGGNPESPVCTSVSLIYFFSWVQCHQQLNTVPDLIVPLNKSQGSEHVEYGHLTRIKSSQKQITPPPPPPSHHYAKISCCFPPSPPPTLNTPVTPPKPCLHV